MIVHLAKRFKFAEVSWCKEVLHLRADTFPSLNNSEENHVELSHIGEMFARKK